MSQIPPTYIKALSSRYIVFGEDWIFLSADQAGTCEVERQKLLSVSFLGNQGFFQFFFLLKLQTRREDERVLLSCSKGSHLQRWWEESQRSDRFLHTCASFPQGVDPYSSRTDLHELNLRNEWEGCRWGKGPLRRSPCKEKFEAHFEEKALCCGLPGGTTLEIWALFKKSQCRGESDWTSLFVQWVMTAVVREQRGAVLLQFENFLDWINGQIPTWLTPYLPAYLNTALNSVPVTK